MMKRYLTITLFLLYLVLLLSFSFADSNTYVDVGGMDTVINMEAQDDIHKDTFNYDIEHMHGNINMDLNEVEDKLDVIMSQLLKYDYYELKGVVVRYLNNTNSTSSDYKVREKLPDYDMYADITLHQLDGQGVSVPEGPLSYLINNNILHRDSKYSARLSGVWHLDSTINRNMFGDSYVFNKSDLLMALVKNYEGVILGNTVGGLYDTSGVSKDQKTKVLDFGSKELLGLLGVNIDKTTMMINWGKNEIFNIYVNPNIYDLYFKKAFNEGLVSPSEINPGTSIYKYMVSSENSNNLYYKWDDTANYFGAGLNTINSAAANKLSTFKSLSDIENNVFSNIYGDRWLFDDSQDIKYTLDPSVDIFMQESMRNIDVLQLIERFMRHYEKDLPEAVEQAVQYTLGYSVEVLPEDQETINYLVARGVLDFEDANELLSIYSEVSTSQVLEWLYRLSREDQRVKFEPDITQLDLSLIDMGFKKTTRTLGNSYTTTVLEETNFEAKFPRKIRISDSVFQASDSSLFTLDNINRWFYTSEEYNTNSILTFGTDYNIYYNQGYAVFEFTDEAYNRIQESNGAAYINSSEGGDYPGIVISASGNLVEGDYDTLTIDNNYHIGAYNTKAFILSKSTSLGTRDVNYANGGGSTRTQFLIIDNLKPKDIVDGNKQHSHGASFMGSPTDEDDLINFDQSTYVPLSLGDENITGLEYKSIVSSRDANEKPLSAKVVFKYIQEVDESGNTFNLVSKIQDKLLIKDGETFNVFYRDSDVEVGFNKEYLSAEDLEKLGIKILEDRLLWYEATDTYIYLLKDNAIIGTQVLRNIQSTVKVQGADVLYNYEFIAKVLNPTDVKPIYKSPGSNEFPTVDMSYISPFLANGRRNVKHIFDNVNQFVDTSQTLSGSEDIEKVEDSSIYSSLTTMTNIFDSIYVPLEGLTGQLSYAKIEFKWNLDLLRENDMLSNIPISYSEFNITSLGSLYDKLYRKPLDPTLQDIWDTNTILNNTVLSALFGKSDNFGVSSYMYPEITIIAPDRTDFSPVTFEEINVIPENTLPGTLLDKSRIKELFIEDFKLGVVISAIEKGSNSVLKAEISTLLDEESHSNYLISNNKLFIDYKGARYYNQGGFENLENLKDQLQDVSDYSHFTLSTYTSAIGPSADLFLGGLPVKLSQVRTFSNSYTLTVLQQDLLDYVATHPYTLEGSAQSLQLSVTADPLDGSKQVLAKEGLGSVLGSTLSVRNAIKLYTSPEITQDPTNLISLEIEGPQKFVIVQNALGYSIEPIQAPLFFYFNLPHYGFMQNVALRGLNINNIKPLSELPYGVELQFNGDYDNLRLVENDKCSVGYYDIGYEDNIHSGIKDLRINSDVNLGVGYMGTELGNYINSDGFMEGSVYFFKVGEGVWRMYPNAANVLGGYLNNIPILEDVNLDIDPKLLIDTKLNPNYDVSNENIEKDISEFTSIRTEVDKRNFVDYLKVSILVLLLFMMTVVLTTYIFRSNSFYYAMIIKLKEDAGLDIVYLASLGLLTIESDIGIFSVLKVSILFMSAMSITYLWL